MANFNSLNSSKANIKSVEDHNENAETAMEGQIKEVKQFAMDKYNVNGQTQRGYNRHKNDQQ
ncbi:hypothetical protein [Clostridium arbusti]|uniref:hypothetical protein n=1 Tax=Clostridium arbusti TaxID=1137848 RepID=UPI00028851A8|nr:hypothetical protein [Clostridium arbusti]